MRSMASESVCWAMWVDSSLRCCLCSMNLILMSSWWSSWRLMVSIWAGVTPSLPIWMVGFRWWAWALSFLRLGPGMVIGCVVVWGYLGLSGVSVCVRGGEGGGPFTATAVPCFLVCFRVLRVFRGCLAVVVGGGVRCGVLLFRGFEVLWAVFLGFFCAKWGALLRFFICGPSLMCVVVGGCPE